MIEISDVAAIAWDLDGTLLDSFGIYEQILYELAEENGHPMPSKEHLQKNYHGSLEDSIQVALGLSSAEELAHAFEQFLQKQESHYDGDINTHLFNDATQLAQQAAAKNIPQLIITNREHQGRNKASPRAIVASTVLADCIDEIRCGDEVEFKKPDKRSIADWLEAIDVAPERLLVIGDQHVDADLASNSGARALLVSRNGSVPHLEHGDHITVVDSLQDIVINLFGEF